MEHECSPFWTDNIETCRSCEGTEIEEVAITSDSGAGSGGLRVKTEPLYGDFCNECECFVMVSLARHCTFCGNVEWLETMDEEIFGD